MICSVFGKERNFFSELKESERINNWLSFFSKFEMPVCWYFHLLLFGSDYWWAIQRDVPCLNVILKEFQNSMEIAFFRSISAPKYRVAKLTNFVVVVVANSIYVKPTGSHICSIYFLNPESDEKLYTIVSMRANMRNQSSKFQIVWMLQLGSIDDTTFRFHFQNWIIIYLWKRGSGLQ